jgi:hypothetical protein
MLFDIGLNCGWHAADHEIGLVEVKRLRVQSPGQGRIVGKTVSYRRDERSLVQGEEKFFEIHGVERQHFDFSHRERVLRTMHAHAQKAACGDNMVLRRPLRKILEAGKCPFGGLNLVQNDERRVGIDFAVEVNLKCIDKASGVNIAGEFTRERGIDLKIDNHGVLEISGAEFLKEVGFAYLSCSI